MQPRLAGGDVRTGCSFSSCFLVVLLILCLFDCFVLNPDGSSLTLFFFRVGGCYFVTVGLDLFFLTYLYTCFAWQTEPPVVEFFGLIFSPPAGYSNPCALSLSASIPFQSGLM
jgi:hypothetical protein